MCVCRMGKRMGCVNVVEEMLVVALLLLFI